MKSHPLDAPESLFSAAASELGGTAMPLCKAHVCWLEPPAK